MEIIESKDNKKIKLAKSLLKSKYRNKENLCLVEGVRNIELCTKYSTIVKFIFISESFYKNENNKNFLNILNKSNKIYLVKNNVFKDISETENSQGIVAIAEIRNLNINQININNYEKVIVLDRVQDPGNLGTILRSADSFGFNLVIVLKGSVDIYNPKVIRASMGSLFYLDILNLSKEKTFEFLKENNYDIITTSLKTKKDFKDVVYKKNTALIIGNEANGVDDFWIENATELVKIPMKGKAESLNVAISSSILMYFINN